MADFSNPPKSPTLLPPRKSVELEDPGAHELGPSLCHPYAINASSLTKLTLKVEASASENEDDVFADASEGQDSHSRPSSPIPTTRVEKVSTPNILLQGIKADITSRLTIGKVMVKCRERRHTRCGPKMQYQTSLKSFQKVVGVGRAQCRVRKIA